MLCTQVEAVERATVYGCGLVAERLGRLYHVYTTSVLDTNLICKSNLAYVEQGYVMLLYTVGIVNRII